MLRADFSVCNSTLRTAAKHAFDDGEVLGHLGE